MAVGLKNSDLYHKKIESDPIFPCVFAFHEGEGIGPRMLARISKHTGLQPGDL